MGAWAESGPLDDPAAVFVETTGRGLIEATRQGDRFSLGPVGVALREEPGGRELTRLVLRWRQPVPVGSVVLGDAWERGYGDLQWRTAQPDRVLPWSWLVYDPRTGRTSGAGVRVRPSSFCSWRLDEDGV